MPVQTASDILTDDTSVLPHNLTPGYSFQGNTATNGGAGQLFRVYVATDRQCVNVVFTGAVVGSPGYAPRVVVPPNTGGQQAADGEPVTPTEAGASGASAPSGASGTVTGTTTGAATTAIPPEYAANGPPIDLWDLGRPNARYWWTVVPVTTSVSSGTTTQPGTTRWHDHRQRRDEHSPRNRHRYHDPAAARPPARRLPRRPPRPRTRTSKRRRMPAKPAE